MILRLLALTIVALLAFLAGGIGEPGAGAAALPTGFMLGFVLLAAHLAGILVERIRLPRITGYLLIGMVLGPHIVGFLDGTVQTNMRVFVDLAYAFIGLAAGGELHLAVLRPRAKSVGLMVGLTALLVLVGVGAVALVVRDLLPGMEGRGVWQAASVAFLIGVIAIARSPSSTIAIIAETQARGPFSETILGVTMATDILILPLFYVGITMTRAAMNPGVSMEVGDVLLMLGEIAGSVGVGAMIGFFAARYVRHRGPQLGLVLLGICFVVYKGSHAFTGHLLTEYGVHVQLEPLLICATVGFVIRNFSGRGDLLGRAMESAGLPVYVVFFTMAGAALDLEAVRAAWLLALVLATARALMLLVGSRLASRLAGDPPPFRAHGWKGFVTQAGLSIALARQLESAFPGWGTGVSALLVAAIAFNQLIGPVVFKQALDKVGETRAARRAAQARAVAERLSGRERAAPTEEASS